MIYNIDIDGILCHNTHHTNSSNAKPIAQSIKEINSLYGNKNKLVLFTSRPTKDRRKTVKWLKCNEVNYNKLIMDKPVADVYIDDKAINFIPHLGAKLNRKKLAICYSGGMDSYLAYHWAITRLKIDPKDIICIYFDIGHPYAWKEKEAMQKIGIPYITMPVGICNPEFDNIPTVDKYIIPGRNMIFASIAGSLADTVWIAGIKFEDHYLMYDKNSNFYRLATLAISQAMGAITTVETPFAFMSKTECLLWAKRHKNIMYHLHDTVSCYSEKPGRCGQCGLCSKRKIAMVAAGIEENDYLENPLNNLFMTKLVKEYKLAYANNDFTHYSQERIEETFEILGIKFT